jgi:cytochrome c peroxidase
VEEQAKGPVLNPVEMAMPTEKHVLTVLNSIPQYVEAFKAAFPDDKNPVTYDNFGKAIGAFERGLVTPGQWDKFLAGDATALTEAEKAGLAEYQRWLQIATSVHIWAAACIRSLVSNLSRHLRPGQGEGHQE